MYTTKVVLATCLVALALEHVSSAQGSPQEWVDAHNAVRKEVGVPPMEWDDTVAAYAQSYANKRAGDCAMEHSGSGRYGENLAKAWGEVTPDIAMKMWAGEKKDYDYATNSCSGEMCGHYTQVVWRDSVYVGCATAKCRNDGYVFGICNYYPPGNYVGQKPY